MPFIGNQPAESYSAFQKQDFTTSATTSYTLNHPVSNQNEIALFINFVRQEPTTAYTASGTTLTLTSATTSSDDMYCIYLGKAVQTVNPPSGSVGTAQIADLAVTSGKLASGVLPTNTPAFEAYLSSDQSISDATLTKVNFNTERFDTNSTYDNSTNYRFTPGIAGKYFIYSQVLVQSVTSHVLASSLLYIYKNGSSYQRGSADPENSSLTGLSLSVQATMDLSTTDYVEIFGLGSCTSGSPKFNSADQSCYFGAYRIIGA
jgi:hypothetical protein